MTEIDKLYDEDNNDLIYLFNEKGEEIAFEQIALIPIKQDTFAILKPVVPLEGLNEDEGLVFEIKVNEDGLEYLMLVVDEKIIDDVFEIYFKLVEENEEE
jgi:uncharacterized protein YrzB (UPF0473 family)